MMVKKDGRYFHKEWESALEQRLDIDSKDDKSLE